MAEAVGVTLPVEDGLPAAEYVALAQLAERSGYDAVLAGEVAGPEVFSLLGMIAARTTSIRIGSGIVGCYARPPALTAMGFATLASYAPGRVIAGLGASSPIIVEGWYGRPFGEPVATVREFIAVLRQALSGARVSFAGQVLRSDGFRATMIPPSPVPVLLAAMNPAMLRLAGQAADGVFLTWTPPGEVAGRLARVRDGERAAVAGSGVCPGAAGGGGGAAGRADPGRRAGRRRRSAGHDHRPRRGAGPARAGPGSRALATMIAPAQAGKLVLVEMDDVALRISACEPP